MTSGLLIGGYPAIQTPTFVPLALDGGGWVAQMVQAGDGTMIAKPDTFDAYLWNGTSWQSLVNTNTMPAADVGMNSSNVLNGGQGVYAVAIAPSNTNIFWMLYNGFVYKGTRSGNTVSWTNTSSGQISATSSSSMNANTGYRTLQPKLAIHPTDPNTVVISSAVYGVWYTTNGGTTWTQITAIPANVLDRLSQPVGHSGICFDPATPTTVYCAAFGSGVYQTTTGVAGTWSLLSGSPQYVETACVQGGVYYVCGLASSSSVTQSLSSTSIFQYSGGTWTTPKTDANGIHQLAFDPNIANRVVYVAGSGQLNQSLTGVGGTWAGLSNVTTLSGSGDVGWLGSTSTFLSAGSLFFDYSTANKIWLSAGVGVWYTTSLPTGGGTASLTYNSMTKGIQNMISRNIVSPTGGPTAMCFDDQQGHIISDPLTNPSVLNRMTGNFGEGASLDFDRTNYASSKVIAQINQWAPNDYSGYYNGTSWTRITRPDTGYTGGCIACSTSTNWVVIPKGNNTTSITIYYTTDAGTTWNAASGLPATWPGAAGYGASYNVTADTTPGTFWAMCIGAGTYRSTDGGATWSLVDSTFTGSTSTNVRLGCVPGQPGNLFLSQYGSSVGTAFNAALQSKFYRTTNALATTWQAVTNVTCVQAFGYGAAAPGQSYPTIWIAGFVFNGSVWTYGIYRSRDNCVTWDFLTQFPFGRYDQVLAISGDGNDYSKCYIGFQRSSFAYGYNL